MERKETRMSNERAIDILNGIKVKDAKEKEAILTAIKALKPQKEVEKCENAEKVV